MDKVEEAEFVISEQRRELNEATDLEADLEFAFHLQMQEALAASLALQPSTSTSTASSSKAPIIPLTTNTISLPSLQALELDILEQELNDRKRSEAEMRKITEEVNRTIHDRKFAEEIVQMSDDEWEEFGDEIEKPFLGSSEGEGGLAVEEPFRLYFKGLLDGEACGIGAAVCDYNDDLVVKIGKRVAGEWRNQREVELKALIEGLNAALSVGVKRIDLYFVNRTIFNQILGRWQVKQRRIATLVNQVFHLQGKFEACRPFLVAGQDLKFAFKLARDAIDSLVTRCGESSNTKSLNETCSICLEDTDTKQMFAVEGCLHRYCSSCMKQHMEVKILQGVIPGCPHEGCKTTLSVDGTKKVLNPKLVERMSQLIKEASVPVTEKVYCPYPKCSTLMSKAEALAYANKFMAADRSVVRKCVNCHGLFCVDCKVQWHNTMTCAEFKRSNLSTRVEETKLKRLANQNLWRQCVKCNHMIELAEGCYHMTCRCGYEFCYTCGAEWKNKKPTCSCKIWDERNIINNYDDGDDDDAAFDDEDDYEDYDDSDEDEDAGYVAAWPHRF